MPLDTFLNKAFAARRKTRALPAGATVAMGDDARVIVTLPADTVSLEALQLGQHDLEVWEDTPRITVQAIWNRMEAALPTSLFASTHWLRSEALQMQPGWPDKTYGFLRCAESAGLTSREDMAVLEKMLQEWL